MDINAEQISTSNSSANTESDDIVGMTDHPTSDTTYI